MVTSLKELNLEFLFLLKVGDNLKIHEFSYFSFALLKTSLVFVQSISLKTNQFRSKSETSSKDRLTASTSYIKNSTF